MLKDRFEFPCPCCGKRIEFDIRTGEARAVKPSEARHGKDLDTLLSDHKQEGERLDHMFRDAERKTRKQPDRLKDLFEKAKDEVREEGDDGVKPRNPFDLE